MSANLENSAVATGLEKLRFQSKPKETQAQRMLKLPHNYSHLTGFPHSSVGKESACNAGDPGSIPELGRSPGEGIGYPLQYSSLVAQLVKNPPAMQETPV